MLDTYILIALCVCLGCFLLAMFYKNKPIMVNGININRNSYFNSLIKSIVGKTIKPPPKQLELFRGTNATI